MQKLMYAEVDRMHYFVVIKAFEPSDCFASQGYWNRLSFDARAEGFLSRRDDTDIQHVNFKHAFWQIPLNSSNREKAAGWPFYNFTVMLFVLCNALRRFFDSIARFRNTPGALGQKKRAQLTINITKSSFLLFKYLVVAKWDQPKWILYLVLFSIWTLPQSLMRKKRINNSSLQSSRGLWLRPQFFIFTSNAMCRT